MMKLLFTEGFFRVTWWKYCAAFDVQPGPTPKFPYVKKYPGVTFLRVWRFCFAKEK